MSQEIWKAFDDLSRTLHLQAKRVEELEQRIADLEQRLAAKPKLELLEKEVA